MALVHVIAGDPNCPLAAAVGVLRTHNVSRIKPVTGPMGRVDYGVPMQRSRKNADRRLLEPNNKDAVGHSTNEPGQLSLAIRSVFHPGAKAPDAT